MHLGWIYGHVQQKAAVDGPAVGHKPTFLADIKHLRFPRPEFLEHVRNWFDPDGYTDVGKPTATLAWPEVGWDMGNFCSTSRREATKGRR